MRVGWERADVERREPVDYILGARNAKVRVRRLGQWATVGGVGCRREEHLVGDIGVLLARAEGEAHPHVEARDVLPNESRAPVLVFQALVATRLTERGVPRSRDDGLCASRTAKVSLTYVRGVVVLTTCKYEARTS